VLAAAVGLAATFPARAEPRDERPREGDVLVAADGAAAVALTPGDIVAGRLQTLAWPMEPATGTVRSGSRLNKVLLLRLDPATLDEATRAHAADGVVAYSAICPHAGCEVTGWLLDQQIIECPCHASHYNPRQGATVIDGPTMRPLPALPLKIAEGKLVVARPFTSRPGIIQS
jgi:rieske iron-sulfur protein